MDNAQKILESRIARLTAAMNLREPDRVPVVALVNSWAAHYTGKSLMDFAFAYDAGTLKESYTRFARDFDLDAITPPGGCRSGPLYSTLGSTEFSFFQTDGSSHPGVQHLGRTNMEAAEYPALIADAYAFTVDTVLPRRFPALQGSAPRRMMNLAKGALQYSEFVARSVAPVADFIRQEFGMPVFTSSATEMPLDLLADYYRGFSGLTMDIRRCPDQVIAACEALLPLLLAAAIGNKKQEDFPTVFIPLHIPTYLKPKDFGTFYFPTFKAMIEGIIQAGRRPTLFMEGNWLPYAEFFQELPKGKVNGIYEHGDHREMKKLFGNVICLIGGMPLQLLHYGSKDEVVAHTRRLIDDMAPGGGWILSPDKTLLSANDAKAENIQAMLATVREYGGY